MASSAAIACALLGLVLVTAAARADSEPDIQTFDGECEAFHRHVASHGVRAPEVVPSSSGRKSRQFRIVQQENAGTVGRTFTPIKVQLLNTSDAGVAFTTTNDGICVSAPVKAVFTPAITIHALRWQPPVDAPQACVADNQRFNAAVINHEYQHVRDMEGVFAAFNGKWSGRRLEACGSTRREAIAALGVSIERELTAEYWAVSDKLKEVVDAFHAAHGTSETLPNCGLCGKALANEEPNFSSGRITLVGTFDYEHSTVDTSGENWSKSETRKHWAIKGTYHWTYDVTEIIPQPDEDGAKVFALGGSSVDTAKASVLAERHTSAYCDQAWIEAGESVQSGSVDATVTNKGKDLYLRVRKDSDGGYTYEIRMLGSFQLADLATGKGVGSTSITQVSRCGEPINRVRKADMWWSFSSGNTQVALQGEVNADGSIVDDVSSSAYGISPAAFDISPPVTIPVAVEFRIEMR